MTDYYYDVKVKTFFKITQDDVFNILEALEDYFAAASLTRGGVQVELSMTVITNRDEENARKHAILAVKKAFNQEIGPLSVDRVDVEFVEKQETSDAVNPAHYTWLPVEVIEITEHLNFCRGNAIKYLCRAGLKDPDKEVEDLEKALWYVQREIARVKSEKS